MFITMQGDWTVRVKSKSAAFPQQFTISGAASGNGTYAAPGSGAPAVSVTGTRWVLSIEHNNGTGFQASNLRIRFPQVVGNQYEFDLQSDDSGSISTDGDYNDLVLTCSTPVRSNEYLIYGNASAISGRCLLRPCFRDWVVIDTFADLQLALKDDRLRAVIEKLYPERIPLPFPPQPDPGPEGFRPLMINLLDEFQVPAKELQVYERLQTAALAKASKAAKDEVEEDQYLATNLKKTKVLRFPTSAKADLITYNRLGLVKYLERLRFNCQSEGLAYTTLHMEEYDRTTSEKAGGPYTGTGIRKLLGQATTDAFGNYVFRFQVGFIDQLIESFSDLADGEVGHFRPDIIGKLIQMAPTFQVLYESAPRFNVRNLQRIDFCIPKSQVATTGPQCFNGALISRLGNVVLSGNQNNAASFSNAALTRTGVFSNSNTLSYNGIISVKDRDIAGFEVDCAAWSGRVDLFGCMYNMNRAANEPIIRNYTIRFKKNIGDAWEYVVQDHVHPKYIDTNGDGVLDALQNQLVGPFNVTVNEDGAGIKAVNAYKNIQAEIAVDRIPWEDSLKHCFMRLNTNIYERDQPGTVYFRVDGYDAAGNQVGTDMIALYISNRPLDYGFGAHGFTSPVESLNCGLFRLFDGLPAEAETDQLRTPYTIPFKVVDHDPKGFVHQYKLTFGKCPTPMALDYQMPGIAGTTDPANGIILERAMPNDATCPGFSGTADTFGTTDLVPLTIQPGTGEKWLEDGVEYSLFTCALSASRRVTNGYNSGIQEYPTISLGFGVLRK